MENTFSMFIVIVLVILAIIFIVKKLIGMAVITVFAILLYNLFFSWSGNQVIDKLKVNEYLRKADQERITSFYQQFRQREKEIYGEDK